MIYFRLLHAGSMSGNYLVLYPTESDNLLYAFDESCYIVELEASKALELYWDDVLVQLEAGNDTTLTIRHQGKKLQDLRYWKCNDNLKSVMSKCTQLINKLA